MLEVIHSAFRARRPVDPPSAAIDETAGNFDRELAARAAQFWRRSAIARRASSWLLPGPDGVAKFTRVSVHPELQRHGIASAMVPAAEELAAIRGFERVELLARAEFPDFLAFWQHRGFVVDPYGRRWCDLDQAAAVGDQGSDQRCDGAAGRAAGPAAAARGRDPRCW